MNLKKENLLLGLEQRKQTMVYWSALMCSGAYKLRDISCAGKQLTDEEKLKDCKDTLEGHLHAVYEIIDRLNEINREEAENEKKH